MIEDKIYNFWIDLVEKFSIHHPNIFVPCIREEIETEDFYPLVTNFISVIKEKNIILHNSANIALANLVKAIGTEELLEKASEILDKSLLSSNMVFSQGKKEITVPTEYYLNNEVLRVAGFEKESIVDGPGIRFTIFVQGCTHHCQGCHNPETWPINQGQVIPIKQIFDEILERKIISGVTFSGGEPFLQYKPLSILAHFLKEKKIHLMAYSGFTFEELQKNKNTYRLLKYIDILVDGPFIEEEKSLELKFRGSKNQRMIDVQQSLAKNIIAIKG